MTSATRKPSASQRRISTSSTGLSSRARDANRSAALSPRDTKTGASCLARVSLVPSVTITGVATSATERPVVSAGGGRHAGLLAYCIFHTVRSVSGRPHTVSSKAGEPGELTIVLDGYVTVWLFHAYRGDRFSLNLRTVCYRGSSSKSERVRFHASIKETNVWSVIA